MLYQLEMALNDMSNLFQLIGIGGYSIGKHLLVAGLGMVIAILMPVMIAKFRGVSIDLQASIARDMLLAFGCLLSLLFAPAFLFFAGRAYLLALVGRD